VAAHYNYRNKEFRLRNAARTAERRPSAHWRRAVEWLLEADIKLKSTKTDNRIILEQLISQLCKL